MMLRVRQSHSLEQGVETESCQHADRHSSVEVMGMAMLAPHRNHIQGYLDEEARQDKDSNVQIVLGHRSALRMVELGKQVQKSETQKVRAREGVKQLHMFGLVEPKQEDAECPEHDAGEQKQVVHCK